eukprot:m.362478 g.362478  ORF g.362478 m.362478 type:complete len:408 (+) comp19961_c1_seq10:3809-5032(+)
MHAVNTPIGQEVTSRPPRPLFFVVPVADDPAHLARLLASLARVVQADERNQQPTFVIVVDMGKTSSMASWDQQQKEKQMKWGREEEQQEQQAGEQEQHQRRHRSHHRHQQQQPRPFLFPVDVVRLPSEHGFSRAIALRAGVDRAHKLAQRLQRDDAIVFAMDTSMVTEVDTLGQLIRNNVQCGWTVFAPVVFKCLNFKAAVAMTGNATTTAIYDTKTACSDGFWANTGYGMLGICLSDYNRTPGYNPDFGYSWGGEDVDMVAKARRVVPVVVRRRVAGFYHVRPHLSAKEDYYVKTKSNTPSVLPVTPLTAVLDVTDAATQAWARSLLPTVTNCSATADRHDTRCKRVFAEGGSVDHSLAATVHDWSFTYVPMWHATVHLVWHHACSAQDVSTKGEGPCLSIATTAL